MSPRMVDENSMVACSALARVTFNVSPTQLIVTGSGRLAWAASSIDLGLWLGQDGNPLDTSAA